MNTRGLELLALRTASVANRNSRQLQVALWCQQAFGVDHAGSTPQRALRLAEEAIEAAQSAGVEEALVQKLVDYIYRRPVGNLAQEIGGVGVTLLALAESAELSAEDCEREEIDRVLSLPLEHFQARNAAKNAAGFGL